MGDLVLDLRECIRTEQILKYLTGMWQAHFCVPFWVSASPLLFMSVARREISPHALVILSPISTWVSTFPISWISVTLIKTFNIYHLILWNFRLISLPLSGLMPFQPFLCTWNDIASNVADVVLIKSSCYRHDLASSLAFHCFFPAAYPSPHSRLYPGRWLCFLEVSASFLCLHFLR